MRRVLILATVAAVTAGCGDAQTSAPRSKREATTTTMPRPTWSQRVRASRRALIDELAPLRRPQTVAERRFAQTLNRSEAPFEELYGTPDRGLVRFATTTPWGERVYLVPITPWTPQQMRARAGPSVHAAPPVEHIVAYSRSRGEAAFGDAKRIGNAPVGNEEAGAISHGRSTTTRLFELVPDGIAKVTWVLPRQPGGSQYGYPTYPRVAVLSAAVHGNLAAARTRRELGSREVMRWYAADGHLARSFGSIAAARRVVAVDRPGPQTAQSRAAERDPSTPNQVSVTPAVGGPHARFVLHFRVLLNNAAYRFRVRGPSCPGYTFAGGYSQPTGPRGNLRGDLLNAPLIAFGDRTLCRGTYRVAASVSAIEPIGNTPGRNIDAAPFGSVTFTVR